MPKQTLGKRSLPHVCVCRSLMSAGPGDSGVAQGMGPRAPLNTGPREVWGHKGTDCIQPPGGVCQPDLDASLPTPYPT